jgi:hypothetical protein
MAQSAPPNLPPLLRELLRIIKSTRGINVESLCRRASYYLHYLNDSKTVSDPLLDAIYSLSQNLSRLCELHLIDIQSPNGSRISHSEFWGKAYPSDYTVFVSSQLISLESLLDVDLSQNDVRSIFGKPIPSPVWPDVFVLMPFANEMKPIFDKHISKVCARLKLSVKRADNFFGAHAIMDDIWSAIVFSKFIIADLSGKNGNVFYELGMAHTIGKNAIIISQSTEDIPFDLRHLRIIVYQYTPPGMQEFERKLRSTLEQAI